MCSLICGGIFLEGVLVLVFGLLKNKGSYEVIFGILCL